MPTARLIFLVTVACAACDSNKPAPAEVPAAPGPTAAAPGNAPAAAPTQPAAPASQAKAGSPEADAKAVFAQRCTLCHGLAGRGDGPAAATLNPHPRNYADPQWQASVQDDYLAKVIVEGGPAVGKSMMMPPNPDLKDKPLVVAEIVHIIRGFKK